MPRCREPTVSAYRNDLRCFAVLTAARQHSDTAHALVALLGMLGLRVRAACQAQVADLRYAGQGPRGRCQTRTLREMAPMHELLRGRGYAAAHAGPLRRNVAA